MKTIGEEIDTMMTDAGQRIASLIAGSSFEFWNRKDFRLYVNFNSLDRTEQDRIFNELEVSILGLFTLHLDNAISLVAAKEKKVALNLLKESIYSGFLQMMSDLGIENKFLKEWKVLIDMRINEYRKDFKTTVKKSSNWKELKNEDEKMKLAWSRTETITIDCLTHIRQGDVKKEDPLWKLLRKWFITLDFQLEPIASLGEDSTLN